MVHATLGSMNEGQPASPVQGNPDAKPSRSSTDVPEVSRSEADAGSGPSAEHINPSLSGIDTGGSPQTGAIASLLSKIPALPIEVVRALEEFKTSIDERVVGAINAFLAEFGARMDADDAKAKASQSAVIARMDALIVKVDSLRREVRLILALSTLLLVFVVLLVYLSYTNRSIVQNVATPSTTEQVDAPIAEADEPSTTSGSPAPSTSSASEDVAGPIGDTTTTDGLSRSTDP